MFVAGNEVKELSGLIVKVTVQITTRTPSLPAETHEAVGSSISQSNLLPMYLWLLSRIVNPFSAK